MAPLLKLLRTICIGGRKGAREMELELEQKSDQAVENLIG